MTVFKAGIEVELMSMIRRERIESDADRRIFATLRARATGVDDPAPGPRRATARARAARGRASEGCGGEASGLPPTAVPAARARAARARASANAAGLLIVLVV